MLSVDRQNERWSHLAEICQRFSIDILYVFGSRATQVYQWFTDEIVDMPATQSDVDIGIQPSSSAPFSIHEKVLLALELEELMSVPRVDLVSLRDVNPFLAVNVVRGECLYSSDNDLTAEFELYIFRSAGDLLPFERERVEMILGLR